MHLKKSYITLTNINHKYKMHIKSKFNNYPTKKWQKKKKGRGGIPSPDLGVCMGRVEGIFDPTHHGGSKKNSTQPNPSHKSTWVGLNPWVWQIFIIIIIKLSKKNININILKKPKD